MIRCLYFVGLLGMTAIPLSAAAVVAKNRAVSPGENPAVDFALLEVDQPMRLSLSPKVPYRQMSSVHRLGTWLKTRDHVFDTYAEGDENGEHTGRVGGLIWKDEDDKGPGKKPEWDMQTKGKVEPGISVRTVPDPGNKDQRRRTVGVGERVELKITGVKNPEKTTWTASGPLVEDIEHGPQQTAIVVVGPQPGTVNITAKTASGKKYSAILTVVLPTSEKGIAATGDDIGPAIIGAGMVISPFSVEPRTVSFQRLEVREQVIGPSAMYGDYQSGVLEAGDHDEDAGAMRANLVSESNEIATDHAFFIQYVPVQPNTNGSYSNSGFTWVIPIEYKLGGTTTDTWLPACFSEQVFSYDTTGTATVRKMGWTAVKPIDSRVTQVSQQ